jgi:hypothetical protein
LYRTGIPEADITEWLSFAFAYLVNDQEQFRAAIEEVKKNGKLMKVRGYDRVTNRDITVRVMKMKTDSQHVLRAVNFLKIADVLMVQQTKGNVQFFLQNKSLSLVNLMRMVAWLETQGKTDLKWNVLGNAGTNPASSLWYYQIEAEFIFNGSITHPDVPPTRIYAQGFEDALNAAFHPGEVALWKRQRGIDVPQQHNGFRRQDAPKRFPKPTSTSHKVEAVVA